jgi:hypothetical protein
MSACTEDVIRQRWQRWIGPRGYGTDRNAGAERVNALAMDFDAFAVSDRSDSEMAMPLLFETTTWSTASQLFSHWPATENIVAITLLPKRRLNRAVCCLETGERYRSGLVLN